jgi:predicted nucleotidyltransferase component of viral defense system
MRLCDQPDFADLTRASADYFQLRDELIVKDYWVTRCLLALSEADSLRGRVVFKGGTSLSKGFRLLDRFSEDIDLLLTGENFGPVPDGTERRRVLRQIDEVVAAGTGLECPRGKFTIVKDREFWRVRRSYSAVYRYMLPGKDAAPFSPAIDWIKVEPGYRGGPQPHVTRSISSLCAEFLAQQSHDVRQRFNECESDLAPFGMELLAPLRTFAEKLLALHEGANIGVIEPRHYYDITRLVTLPEVEAALQNGSFAVVLGDAIEVSNQYFSAQLDGALDLRSSRALNLDDELMRDVKAKYESQANLYYRGQPPFDDMLASIDMLRDRLPRASKR